MKQPKPILTIKQKCRCVDFSGAVKLGCELCKGTGEQEINFEKCDDVFHDSLLYGFLKCKSCSGTRSKKGYIIPKEYEPYEIKKVIWS